MKLSEVELSRYRLMAEAAARSESDLFALAGIREGAVVADVGCGPGAMAVVLGGLVGPSGRVLAVDRDESALAAARAEVDRAGLGNTTVSAGDADDTGLSPGSVDVVMIRHVLAHNGGREQAIVSHAASLLRPGGCMYLLDIDWTAVRDVPHDPDLQGLADRYHQWHIQRGNDLSVGLRLGALLTAAGLEVLDFQGRYMIFPIPPGLRPPSWAGRDALVADGLATEADVERWAAAFQRIDEADERPTIFSPLLIAVGRRPGGPHDVSSGR